MEQKLSGGEPLDTSKLKTIASELSSNESKTGSLTTRRYSAISEHSIVKGTPSNIREWLMSSLRDSPANRTPFVENEGGGEDERNMWPETISTIRIIRPQYVWLENVTGLLTSGYFGTILESLSQSGYVGRYISLGSSFVGSLCEGQRLWVLAIKADCAMLEGMDVSKSFLSHQKESFRRKYTRAVCAMLSQDDYTRIKRDTNAVARGMERLKAIGNGQDPFLVAAAWRILSEGLI